MPTDQPTAVAFDARAPAPERTQALAELQKAHVPSALADLLPQPEVQQAIDYIAEQWREEQMRKALGPNVIPFPSRNAREHRRGMQSVQLDELRVTAVGDYIEKPSLFGFDALRRMVAQTPVLNAVVMTRVRQIQRFCRVNETGEGPGFSVAHIDRRHELSEREQESIRLLNRFIANCGWEFNPRARRRLGRDSFSQFMAKSVRDSLTLDSAPIETELAVDKRLGIDGLYPVDGATIRLCTEQGYRGHDEIFALQVVQGRICAAYDYDDLIYEPRNAQTDVLAAGYGLAEPELMIRVVTGFLNAMTYNIKGFDSNAIPKGILQLTGDYSDRDIAAFKRYWNSMVRGVQNAWAMPVLTARDPGSKATFEGFGVEFNEMYFSKWMTFLTSIICAIYGMSPAEINFDSFTAGNTSALSGSDTDEKLAASRDSGLWPLLSYYEGVFTDYVISNFSEKYVFRWTGIDQDDAQKREERARMVMTVNEMRSQERLPPLQGDFGDAPLNPSLTGVWMQLKQAEQQQDQQPDFGQAPDEDQDQDDEQGGDAPEDQDDGQDDPRAAGGAPQDDEEGESGRQGPDQDDEQPVVKAEHAGNPYHDEKGRFSVAPDEAQPNRALAISDDEALAYRAFLDGPPVAVLTGDEFKPDGVPLTQKVPQWYAARGDSVVVTPGIGDVLLDKRAVADSIAHGMGRDKAAAFAAVPDVLRHGRIIHAEAARGSKSGGMAYHVAAPVEMRGADYVVVVLVKTDPNVRRMYVHEVAAKKGLQQGAFKTGAVAAEAGKRSGANNRAGAIRSVLQSIYSVKPPDAHESESLKSDPQLARIKPAGQSLGSLTVAEYLEALGNGSSRPVPASAGHPDAQDDPKHAAGGSQLGDDEIAKSSPVYAIGMPPIARIEFPGVPA